MTDLKKTIVGKVGSKKRLHEADTNYTPEEINKFVAQATKDVENLKKVFTTFKGKVENLSIAGMLKSPGEVESLHEKLKTAKEYAKQQYEYYFDIVEPYDFMDPEIRQLDKLTQKLTYLQENLSYVYDAMDYMVDAAKDFNRFYSVEDEES